jgi:hypothetical protein
MSWIAAALQRTSSRLSRSARCGSIEAGGLAAEALAARQASAGSGSLALAMRRSLSTRSERGKFAPLHLELPPAPAGSACGASRSGMAEAGAAKARVSEAGDERLAGKGAEPRAHAKVPAATRMSPFALVQEPLLDGAGEP